MKPISSISRAGGPGFNAAGIAQERVPLPSRSLRRAGIDTVSATGLTLVRRPTVGVVSKASALRLRLRSGGFFAVFEWYVIPAGVTMGGN